MWPTGRAQLHSRNQRRLAFEVAPADGAPCLRGGPRGETRVDVVHIDDEGNLLVHVGVHQRIEMIEVHHIRAVGGDFLAQRARHGAVTMTPEQDVGFAPDRRQADLDRLRDGRSSGH